MHRHRQTTRPVGPERSSAHFEVNRVRELADGGVWNTLAGQPTDDSEMALARSIVRSEGRSIEDIQTSYVRWKK